MATITAIFNLEKETKGALRYEEVTEDGAPYTVADGAPFGQLYVRKSAFKGKPPVTLSVVADFDE